MRHPGRLAVRLTMVPLAVGALLLTACGSDNSSTASSTVASTASSTVASTADFNSADVAFAQDMIPHHQQAVEMADLALASRAGASTDVQALATSIKSAQGPEIEMMTSWLNDWGRPLDMPMTSVAGMDMNSKNGGMDGMMTADDMANLATLTGSEFDTAWLTMMIEHHQGAISQAETAKPAGSNAAALELADQIITSQHAQIDQMRALLAG